MILNSYVHVTWLVVTIRGGLDTQTPPTVIKIIEPVALKGIGLYTLLALALTPFTTSHLVEFPLPDIYFNAFYRIIVVITR